MQVLELLEEVLEHEVSLQEPLKLLQNDNFFLKIDQKLWIFAVYFVHSYKQHIK